MGMSTRTGSEVVGDATDPPLGRDAAAIFLLSLGVLMVEVSLTRIFSYSISYHFAYLTISTALLGFGAAGSLLVAFPAMFGGGQRRVAVSAILAALATVATLAFSSVVRFDPNQLRAHPSSFLGLLGYSCMVTLPFLFAGLAIVTLLARHARRIGTIYAWDLLGAALGCALAVPLIWVIETPAAVVTGALALAVGGVVVAGGGVVVAGGTPVRSLALGGLALTLLAGGATVRFGPFPPSPGKLMSTFLAGEGAQHLYAQWTPISRVDAIAIRPAERGWGSYGGAGVGARFTGVAPPYRMIGYDGGSFAVMYAHDGSDAGLDLFRHHVMAVPYRVQQDPSVLIIGLGGGADALTARANGARTVTGLELNPVTVRLGREDYAEFNGNVFNAEGVEVVNAEARHWIESTDERFDLVVLNSIDTFSALSSGAYVLAESYLYTTEAFTTYLEHLGPDGMFSLVSFDNAGLAGPTFIILRFASTLVAALEHLGVTDPQTHVAIVASRADVPLVNVMVRRRPFTAAEVATLERFAADEGFDFWHRPDRAVAHQVGQFLWATPAERRTIVDEHYLRLAPAVDDSPFFFNFYKWRSLLLAHPDDRGTTPATGQRMLLLMIGQAILLSVAIVLWPLRRLSGGRAVPQRLGVLLYFTALGIGFIFIEIAMMQRFVLYLGFPTYSLSVVLFALLTSTGLGSALTARVTVARPGMPLALVAVLAVGVGAWIGGGPALLSATLAWPLSARIVATVAVLMPLGLVLGAFFPLGLRLLEALDVRLVPWAWAINGSATVVGTILAAVVGMTYGFTVAMILALAVYALGALALWGSLGTAMDR